MASKFRLKAEVKGLDKLVKQLKQLGDKKTAHTVLRRGANGGGTPILKAVRTEAPVGETGLTKKAMKKKVTVRNYVANAIIGGDFKVTTEVDGKPHTPAYLLHLIEFGHQAPDGTTVPANPFMRRGWEQAKDAANAKFKEKAEAAIAAAVAKTTRKTRGK